MNTHHMRTNFFAVAVTVVGLAISNMATAGFIDSRTESTAPAKANSVALPAASPSVAKDVAPTARAQSATVILRAGKRMDEELRRIAPSGWTVDAAPFVIPADFVVTNEFESAVGELMRAANAAGVRVRARFYHGNKFLRIVEY